jgi:hypothetical protein
MHNCSAAVLRSFVSPYSTLKVGSYKVARWLGAGFNSSVVTPADVEKGQDTVQKVRSSWAVACGHSWLPTVVWRCSAHSLPMLRADKNGNMTRQQTHRCLINVSMLIMCCMPVLAPPHHVTTAAQGIA